MWTPSSHPVPIPAHIPLKAHLVNLSDISQLLVTLLILMLTDHHLDFKHLLSFQKVLKMEFLSTQSTSHDVLFRICTLTVAAFFKR